ncbi:MAG: sigma-70 family RNA polymerase sigma factor [Polyangiaceae bacterium]|nr:sigma-70 family RNA polymerase sigma factor [Polyangiaceae bacterium]
MRRLVHALRPVIQARVARALLRHRRAARGRDLRQEIEDVVQQVFANLFADGGRALRQWDPQRGLGLLGYVGMLAERDVASILRSRRRSPWTEDPTLQEDLDGGRADADPGPEDEVASREVLSAVVASLRERLSDKGLALFELLVVEGLPVEQVCEAMRMTPEAVYAWRSRLARLARSIAAELAPEIPPERRTTQGKGA